MGPQQRAHEGYNLTRFAADLYICGTATSSRGGNSGKGEARGIWLAFRGCPGDVEQLADLGIVLVWRARSSGEVIRECDARLARSGIRASGKLDLWARCRWVRGQVWCGVRWEWGWVVLDFKVFC